MHTSYTHAYQDTADSAHVFIDKIYFFGKAFEQILISMVSFESQCTFDVLLGIGNTGILLFWC